MNKKLLLCLLAIASLGVISSAHAQNANTATSDNISQGTDTLSANHITFNKMMAAYKELTRKPDPVVPQKPTVIRIACVGDMMLGLNYPDDSPQYAADDGRHLFDDVKPWLQGANLTLGNLEGVLLDTGGEPKVVRNPKYRYFFRMPERYVHLFLDAGFDALTIANNHARDFGQSGLESTQRVLSEAGMAYCGVKDVCETCIIERDGVRYGMCAFAPNTMMCNIHDLALAERLIKKLREEDKCDIVIVTFHGGAEGPTMNHVTRTTETYIGESRGNVYEFSHHCVDAGADLVFGHGPHVVRGVELYKGKIIAYSLGNFCTPYGINRLGPNGYAPVLCVDMTPEGEFVGGEIVPAIQVGREGPKLDHKGIVLGEMRRLSFQDFPESNLVIERDGKLRAR